MKIVNGMPPVCRPAWLPAGQPPNCLLIQIASVTLVLQESYIDRPAYEVFMAWHLRIMFCRRGHLFEKEQ